MYASYRRVRGLGCMTVSEMLKTMHENDLFDMFPEFSNVLHITSSDTCYIVFCRTIIQCVAQIENFGLRSTMGQQRVSNIALINIERAYANSVVKNDMDRIINIFYEFYELM